MQLAVQKGLTAIALTDHDTISGIHRARAALKGGELRFIPGIEISSVYSFADGSKDIHILGLGIDETSTELQASLEAFHQIRNNRNEKMLQRISQLVMEIDPEDFFKTYAGAVITRAHFADYLYRRGAVNSVKEAFDRYVGDGKPCFVPKEGVTCRDAISCILNAGGHPVLAHPPQYRLGDHALGQLIEELAAVGLQGIETVYSTYTGTQERKLKQMCKEYGLHMTGGSDYHGDVKPDIQLGTGLGRLYVPDSFADWISA